MGAGWSQQLVGGGGVCSGGLTLGSGRDRLLAHPVSPWAAVSTIPVSGPVAVKVGGGGTGWRRQSDGLCQRLGSCRLH